MPERFPKDLEKELNSRNRLTNTLRVINITTFVESLIGLEQVVVYQSVTAGETALLTLASSACLYFYLEYSKTKGKEIESQLKTQQKRKNENIYDEKPKRVELIDDGELPFDIEDDDLHLNNHR